MYTKAILLSLIAAASAQQVGTEQAETHPSMTWSKCTGTGGTSCALQSGKVVLDSNWRWVHKVGDYTNCYTDNKWDATLCPDNASCAKNCALEGGDYPGTYGINVSGNSNKLTFITKGQYATNIGSRTYLMADDTNYQMFNLLDQEFTFDVDLSQLPCGLNGALYFVSMDKDGGMSKYPTNKAGAKYGTGYCDAQCPRDLKFINGMVSASRLSVSIHLLTSCLGQRRRMGAILQRPQCRCWRPRLLLCRNGYLGGQLHGDGVHASLLRHHHPDNVQR
jgi:cellulose 1,4-beta-cellobiosidase